MEKTTGESCILFLALVVLVAMSAPLEAALTFDIPTDIIVWVQAYDEVLSNGATGAVLYEEYDPFVQIEQESWIQTKTFNIEAGQQAISFDMGYYTGGGYETDKFNVWLKDSSGNIIDPVFSSMDFPWKSSGLSGTVDPQPVQIVFDSTGGYSNVYLQFHLWADGDTNYWPTMINISNIRLTTPLPSTIVPAPGAFLLGSIGVFVVGWARRTRRSVFE